jgi:hypothetical protein
MCYLNGSRVSKKAEKYFNIENLLKIMEVCTSFEPGPKSAIPDETDIVMWSKMIRSSLSRDLQAFKFWAPRYSDG